MARKTVQANATEEGPFSNLLASRPPRGKGTITASLVSIVGHGLALFGLLYATRAIADEAPVPTEEQRVIELVTPVVIPPPPAAKEMTPDVTPDVPLGFKTLAVPNIVPDVIPPPNPTAVIRAEDFTGQGIKGGTGTGKPVKAGEEGSYVSPESAPHFTPMTVAPRILNTTAVVQALERTYPPLLRDAGIGGDVNVWFFIDENGRVLKTQLDKSSGYEALDQAAMKVADVMRFSPAQNRDKKVPVWVSVPIHFSTR
jgi:protein TonB